MSISEQTTNHLHITKPISKQLQLRLSVLSHLLDDLLRPLPAPADVTQHALDQVKVHAT
jgi:hypothetical protein